ncbi:N-6 DNA methylase [Listeria monocytogenes]|nr:N-6 DNA methylase [Listeria monocytogenes]
MDKNDGERNSDDRLHSSTTITDNNYNEKEVSVLTEASFFAEEFDLFSQSMDDNTPSMEFSENSEIVKIQNPPSKKGINYYRDENNPYPKGAKAKFKANMEAIQLIQILEAANREPSLAEQQVLARFTGWGGLQEAFDPSNATWEKEYKQLKKLLPEDMYVKARSSVLTAYYTEPFIVEEVYKMLVSKGFTGGNILDPSMGTGNFFSKLPAKLRSSKLHGVELDPLAGKIAKYLYPDADIQIKGFEKSHFREESFDLIISNIPFGDFEISDKDMKKNYKIHDYFMQKSAKLLKPGGVMAFITSTGTMDKKDSKARMELAEKLDLVAGVRLPSNVFKQVGGTNVTSDLIFFQKKSEVQATLDASREEVKNNPSANWLDSKQLGNEKLWRNEYFIDNPTNILGDIRVKNFHGQTEEVFIPDYDKVTFQERLRSKLSESSFSWNAEMDTVNEKTIPNETKKAKGEAFIPRTDERCFTYKIMNDSIYYVEKDVLERKDITGKAAERIKGMLKIKDALLDVINIQESSYEQQELENAQLILNEVYDEFVRKNGFINDRANQLAFQADDQLPLLRSIEVPDNENKQFHKAMIFSEATIRPALETVNITTAEEALIYSLNKVGYVDLGLMEGVYQVSQEKLIEELDTGIYFEPYTDVLFEPKPTETIAGEWVTKEAYLSGDVKTKLAQARKIASIHPEIYGRNVDALESVQPVDLKPSEIKYSIGSTWIPKEIYEEFMYDCFETSYSNRRSETNKYFIGIDYCNITSKWSIQGKFREPRSIRANKTFGSDHLNGYEIMEDCLNLQSSTIYNTVRELDENGNLIEKRVVNAKETMVVRGKQQQLQEKFASWLFAERNRSVKLGRLYNDRFNRIVPQNFNGSYLSFPNMSKELTLRPHQQNVIARIVQKKTALMAHEVGAGKTAAMIAAGMYLKRIGTVKKPMFVVPNHLMDQWGMEFLRFFPGANILISSKKDFQKENRKTFTSKIATGNYDAIVIGHSQFERMPLSVERQSNYINSQITEIENEIYQQKATSGQKWTIKQMEGMKKKLTTSLDKLNNTSKKDNVIDFEKLGVDFLFVDEAHNYKNCFVYSKMQGVAGISQSNSQRATDMLMKCQYMQEIQDGAGVVFATGTPISNSMSEMYVMQRYLQPDALDQMSISSFDEWASTFGEVVSSLEATPEGGGYKMKARFAKFHNLPELMNLFSEVADIQTSDMLNLPVPIINGGQAEIVATEATPYQLEVMENFVDRAEKIRLGAVDSSTDNMLKLTHEAKLLAIDPRLLNPLAPNDQGSKLNTCAENVYQIWEKHAESKSTQMIFCDSGTPKKDKFNVYDEVKRILIEKGIPEDQVAFIHDAKSDVQREKLFQKVRDGRVRVLLGSTSKVGTGTNVQDKLIAGHHLDCPWRPSDIIQRDGRVVRQGNSNESVYMYRYVTKSTFDAYLWQIQEQKLSFISQVMTGKSISRDCSDIDETVLSAAEVKAIATSNPLLAEKMTLDNEVMRLKILKGEWQNAKLNMQSDLEEKFPKNVSQLKKDVENLELDAVGIPNKDDDGAKLHFAIRLGDEYFDSRREASLALENISILLKLDVGEKQKIGSFHDLDVYMSKSNFQKSLLLVGNKEYDTPYQFEKGIGNIIKLENLYYGIPEALNKTKMDLQMYLKDWEDTKVEVTKPFIHEKELEEGLDKQNKLNFQLEVKGAGTQDNQAEKEQTEKQK